MEELLFNVIQEEDSGYSAIAVGVNIYTQGDTWQELCDMVQEATRLYFFEGGMPERLRLHLEQVLAVA